MTTMTSQAISEIKAQAAGTLSRGGSFVHETADGATVQIFYVANGAFCRVDTRDAIGQLISAHSGNHQFTHDALKMLRDAVTELGA